MCIYHKIKYIKIHDENIENNIKKDIVDLGPKKQISWEDENIKLNIVNDYNDYNDYNNDTFIEDDIFKKLKKIPPQQSENNNINDRMNILEDKMESLHKKMDLILQILQILQNK